MWICFEQPLSLLVAREVVPDGYGDEWRALFAYYATVQALEGMYDEHKNVSPDSPRQRCVETHGQDSSKQGGEVGGSITEDAPCFQPLSSFDIGEQDY